MLVVCLIMLFTLEWLLQASLYMEAGERKAINSELWHACAGPLVSLPPVGSLVVYFPQGHSEQVCCLSLPSEIWANSIVSLLMKLISGCRIDAKRD